MRKRSKFIGCICLLVLLVAWFKFLWPPLKSNILQGNISSLVWMNEILPFFNHPDDYLQPILEKKINLDQKNIILELPLYHKYWGKYILGIQHESEGEFKGSLEGEFIESKTNFVLYHFKMNQAFNHAFNVVSKKVCDGFILYNSPKNVPLHKKILLRIQINKDPSFVPLRDDYYLVVKKWLRK